MTNALKNIDFKKLTWISLGIMLLIMLFVSKDYGITGDEVTQNTYGGMVYNYFATFGKDQSCMSFKNLGFYGGMYDLFCTIINKFSPFDPYDTRHFINAFCGFMAIFYAAKLAKYYKNWGAAFITAWLLFLSPRFFGESMNNPKDIPFALGMIMASYYIVKFVDSFPKPSVKTSLALVLSIGFAIGIRVGGLLLIPFVVVGVGLQYWFEWRKQYSLGSKEIRGFAIRTLVVCVLGYFAGLIFWPYALQAPLSNPFKALGEMAQFSTGIRMLFEDRAIMSTNVPWYYIPKWLAITTPFIILAGMILSPLLFFRKDYKFHKVAYLFFIAVFPWVYVVYKKSALYDGWRHLLFIYPALMVLAALTFHAILDMVQNKYGKYVIAAVLFLGLLLPAKWSIANHPNEIVYFNETVGGIDGAYGNYETDYYMNSVKQAAWKLADMEQLRTRADSPIVVTNAIEPMLHYMSVINPRIKTEYARYYQRYDKNWDYAIFYTRFIDKSLLQNGFFPPKNTIAVIKADNTPLCAIIKRGNMREDYKAAQYLDAKDFANAATAYQKALADNPGNETGYYPYAVSLANTGQLDAAIGAANAGLKYLPNSIELYDLLSKLYQAKGDMQNASMAANKVNALIIEEQENSGQAE